MEMMKMMKMIMIHMDGADGNGKDDEVGGGGAGVSKIRYGVLKGYWGEGGDRAQLASKIWSCHACCTHEKKQTTG